jgi:hypothetical protein
MHQTKFVGVANCPWNLSFRLAGIISYLIDANEPSERRKLFVGLQSEARRIVFGGGRGPDVNSCHKVVMFFV